MFWLRNKIIFYYAFLFGGLWYYICPKGCRIIFVLYDVYDIIFILKDMIYTILWERMWNNILKYIILYLYQRMWIKTIILYRCYIYPLGCTRSQHTTVSGHCQPASEMPFKWCYAGWPMVACFRCLLGLHTLFAAVHRSLVLVTFFEQGRLRRAYTSAQPRQNLCCSNSCMP